MEKRCFVFDVNRRQAVEDVPEMPEYADKTLLPQTCRMNLPALLSVWQGRWGRVCRTREFRRRYFRYGGSDACLRKISV